jgi:predicted DCC family thiol-disulfide oxidoreductase YuxK
VDLLIKLDKHKRLKFASIQGQHGQMVLSKEVIRAMESIVFYNEGRVYQKSTAVIEILSLLGGVYGIFAITLKIFPVSVLDYLYMRISKNRYKLFGKKNTCRLPTDLEKTYFLD